MNINIEKIYNKNTKNMQKNIENNIINNYLNMPSIKQVLIQVRDLEKILKPDERTISLRHCKNNNYILQEGKKYKLTNEGKKALLVIDEYNQDK